MHSQQPSTVVGVFEDRRHADEAVNEILRAGFRDDQIGVARRHDKFKADAVSAEPASHAGTGAVTGAVTGLGLGALAGLGVVSGVIPVIGPAIAAGTLGVIFSNAAAGAGIAGLAGALIGSGLPQEEARYYQSEFEAGRTVVTVHTDARQAEAVSILRAHCGHDMSTRSAGVNSFFGAARSHQKPV
jgi:hypothetical protein